MLCLPRLPLRAAIVALMSVALLPKGLSQSTSPPPAGSNALTPAQEQHVRKLLKRSTPRSGAARATAARSSSARRPAAAREAAAPAPSARAERARTTSVNHGLRAHHYYPPFPPPLPGCDDELAPIGSWTGPIPAPPIAGAMDRRAFNALDMEERGYRLLTRSEAAIGEGLELQRSGDYRRAMLSFRLAAELNQSDPASRIHLAQSLMALGRYEAAGQAVRRALSLQPKLVYVPLDWAVDFESDEAFDVRVVAMERWFGDGSGDSLSPDGAFLVGYVRFLDGDLSGAQRAFRAAAMRGRVDDALRALLELSAAPDADPSAQR